MSRDAFGHKSRKVNLIKCLTFRTFTICSNNKLKKEFEQIKNLFLSNGYLEEVIVNKFRNNIRPLGPSKYQVYVKLPWIGSPSQLIADKVFFPVLHAVIM